MYESRDSELQSLRSEAQELRIRLEADRAQVRDATLAEACASVHTAHSVQLHKRKTLRGHIGKIVDLHWCPSSDPSALPPRFVCASQSGQLIVWNPSVRRESVSGSACMDTVFKLENSFVICCAFAPSGEYVACAGLDNQCCIFNTDVQEASDRYQMARPSARISGHDGFVSSVRFMDETHLITSSGDATLALFDIEHSKQVPFARFRGHAGAVQCLALSPTDPNLFLSGGCDFTAKLWDTRVAGADGAVQTFVGHTVDINSVTYFPTGQSFVTASDDWTCRLFDIRADQELQMYAYGGLADDPEAPRQSYGAATCVDCSCSGRLLFAGYESGHYIVWDTLKAEKLGVGKAHEARLSCLGVSPDGKALATGSWDSILKIWN